MQWGRKNIKIVKEKALGLLGPSLFHFVSSEMCESLQWSVYQGGFMQSGRLQQGFLKNGRGGASRALLLLSKE